MTTATACVRALPPVYDLFISCQPEAISAHAALRPGRPTVFVCGGTTLLHDGADRADQDGEGAFASLSFSVDRWLKHRNERRAFAAADAVVFDSNNTRSRVIEAYGTGPEKCHTIHGGVDAAAFAPPGAGERSAARAALGVGSKAFVVAWTGRLSPEKNLPLLLSAVAQTSPLPDCVLLVGDGPERTKLASMVERAALSKVVRFAGAQTDVRPYLHAADVFAFPSRGESFGGSLAEAMACGLACIAVRPDGDEIRNASLEALDEAQCGILVGSTPQELADAIQRLRADGSLRANLGARARRRVETHFNWDRGAIALERLLTRLLSAKGADPKTATARQSREIAQKLPTFSEALP